MLWLVVVWDIFVNSSILLLLVGLVSSKFSFDFVWDLDAHRYSPVGRSFYSPNLGTRQPLGDGLESWRGFYQSIRPTQMGLSLNIGKCHTYQCVMLKEVFGRRCLFKSLKAEIMVGSVVTLWIVTVTY